MINIKNFFNLNYYTSQLDLFLEAYRKKHPRLSESQRQEKEKYSRIFKLRDEADASISQPEDLFK